MNKLVAAYSLLHLFCAWSIAAGFANSTSTNLLATEEASEGLQEEGTDGQNSVGTTSSAMGLVVGVVIGVCGALVVLVIFSFGVVSMFVNRHRVGDLDAVEYSIQEEYEAQINFAALDLLDPAIRSRIDMSLLAKLTNTEPALLAPYKNMEEGTIDGTISKLNSLSKSTSLQSLHRQFSLTLQKSHDTSSRDHRSSYDHNWSTNPVKLKRSNTISGISSITMEDREGSVSPMKFVVQCEAEQNVGEVKNLLKIVTESWLITTTLGSMPDMSNKMRRVNGRESDDRRCYVGGDNECAVGMEDGMDRYRCAVVSGGCDVSEGLVLNVMEEKRTEFMEEKDGIDGKEVDRQQL